MKLVRKIAIACSFALAFGAVVVAPAKAADMVLSVKVGTAVAGANSTSAAAPASVTVPADNTVDETDTVRLVATVDTGTSVTFVSTGAIKLVTALDNPSDRKSTCLNSSHVSESRMPSSA